MYLAEQEVEVGVDKDLNLLAELFLDFFLADAAEVGRALADAPQGQGAPLPRHLLGQLGSLPVDVRSGEVEAGLVAPVDQLVVGGVEGERLHHVGAGAQELTVEAHHLLTNFWTG